MSSLIGLNNTTIIYDLSIVFLIKSVYFKAFENRFINLSPYRLRFYDITKIRRCQELADEIIGSFAARVDIRKSESVGNKSQKQTVTKHEKTA